MDAYSGTISMLLLVVFFCCFFVVFFKLSYTSKNVTVINKLELKHSAALPTGAGRCVRRSCPEHTPQRKTAGRSGPTHTTVSHPSNRWRLLASQPLEHTTRLGNSTPSSHTYSTIKTELEKYSYKMITFKKTVLAQKGVIII